MTSMFAPPRPNGGSLPQISTNGSSTISSSSNIDLKGAPCVFSRLYQKHYVDMMQKFQESGNQQGLKQKKARIDEKWNDMLAQVGLDGGDLMNEVVMGTSSDEDEIEEQSSRPINGSKFVEDDSPISHLPSEITHEIRHEVRKIYASPKKGQGTNGSIVPQVLIEETSSDEDPVDEHQGHMTRLEMEYEMEAEEKRRIAKEKAQETIDNLAAEEKEGSAEEDDDHSYNYESVEDKSESSDSEILDANDADAESDGVNPLSLFDRIMSDPSFVILPNTPSGQVFDPQSVEYNETKVGGVEDQQDRQGDDESKQNNHHIVFSVSDDDDKLEDADAGEVTLGTEEAQVAVEKMEEEDDTGVRVEEVKEVSFAFDDEVIDGVESKVAEEIKAKKEKKKEAKRDKKKKRKQNKKEATLALKALQQKKQNKAKADVLNA